VTRNRHLARVALAGELLLVVVTAVAFLIGGDAIGAAIAAGILLTAVVALELLRRRSDTGEVISGIGDERVRALYLRATALSANVLVTVLVGWWLVSVAAGDPNPTLSTLGAVWGVTWLLTAAVLSRRG
jgi:hypothetical protein